MAQAEKAGVRLNQVIATAVAVAGRVGALAEAERYFTARAARVQPGMAKATLARAGVGNPPREDNRLEGGD